MLGEVDGDDHIYPIRHDGLRLIKTLVCDILPLFNGRSYKVSLEIKGYVTREFAGP
jgi:hypothetical protein